MAQNDGERSNETLNFLLSKVPTELQWPAIGVVCGSGLGGLANTLLQHPQAAIPFADIPHFAQSTVLGHAGTLLFGLLELGKRPVVLMVGRLHFYEGHPMLTTTFPIRVMKKLGVKTVITTNAAGSLNSQYAVGDIVILNDHINLAGLSGFHPLLGPNADDFGTRFPAMSDAYDLELRRRAHIIWNRIQTIRQTARQLHEGIYAFVSGPSYETRAECRFLKMIGADLVGMSTVPEVIVARHAEMRVLALSLVTNKALLEAGPRGDEAGIQNATQEQLAKTIEKGKASHGEVLDTARSAEEDVLRLVTEVVRDLLGEDGT